MAIYPREVAQWIGDGDSSWKEFAACKKQPTGLFYGELGGIYDQARKAFCDNCTVREDCLEYANRFEMAVAWRSGLWGGMSPEQRDKEFGTVGKPSVRKPGRRDTAIPTNSASEE